MRCISLRTSLVLAALPAPALAYAQESAAPLPTITAKTAGHERREGLIPILLDATTGQIWLELPKSGTRLLECLTLATGLGSNPVGLDRGSDGGCQVARFEPDGARQLVILENWGYRSSFTDNPDHSRSVAEAFAPSTIAALPIIAAEGDRVLVDATDYLLHDWMDISGTLARSDQGDYSLVKERSSVYLPTTRAYPGNTELEASLTFETHGRPGPIAQQVTPDGRSITLRQHVTLAALPDDGYHPRALDPRINFYGVTFNDYAEPVDAPLQRHWIARHRLERVNPLDASSPIRNPIVYYIDRGIPEPLRTASLEGARFWAEAFDRAGLKDGFRVELLPEGADPMDLRYNVVQWENRNERGWSIGGALVDPRTGEILKGMARMDSHRGRTAFNLIAALAGARAAADTHFVLGRVRQVTAHEIGHTLGMAHNYVASTYDRGSVMDYPAPRLRLDSEGRIDFSQAYATGPGAYDVLAIRWAYGIFPAASEADSLKAIVAEGLRRGLIFLSDNDARPDYASDPGTSLWDDAATPEEFLRQQLAVRAVAMRNFGLGNIREGEPVSTLQERFVPLYFFHRFAARSVAKIIGGVEYRNAVAGDGQQATRSVAGTRQRAALASLLDLLTPNLLAVPDTIRTLLGPRPFGYDESVELFGSRTRPTFDEFGAARSLAELVLGPLLQPDRLGRVVQQSAHDPKEMGLPELMSTAKRAIWDAPLDPNPRNAGIRRAVQQAFADRLLGLAADTTAAPDVRAIAGLFVGRLHDEAVTRGRDVRAPVEAQAHWQALAARIAVWQRDRQIPRSAPLPAPPGDPFGDDDEIF
ncbi:MAG: zinc-dependent metalloprotease [Gemmatimonadota bacterium]